MHVGKAYTLFVVVVWTGVGMCAINQMLLVVVVWTAGDRFISGYPLSKFPELVRSHSSSGLGDFLRSDLVGLIMDSSGHCR